MKPEKIKEFEKTIASDYRNIAGIAIQKNGVSVYENYFNGCTAASRVHVYSVTKSILSLLIGIALDKGLIESTRQKVLDFFPQYTVKKGEKTLQNITLEHILTMTAPYKYRFAPYIKYFTSDDWVTFTLDLLGGRGKIGKFKYTPLIGPDILSGVLVKSTGQSVLDFAADNLFAPLGIAAGKSIVFDTKEEQLAFNNSTDISGWAADGAGTNAGGWGLSLSAADMAKIGQLFASGGLWNGTQVVSPGWIRQSTTEHSRWKERNLSYGYMWWILDEKDPCYAAMGDGGNIIYVNAKKEVVIAIASVFMPKAKDRIELIKKHIEPLLET